MNIKKSIKKMFQSESFTDAALKSIGLEDGLVKNENGSAYIAKIEQANLVAKITIPIDVYEIFIDLDFDNEKITGWVDFYGETKNQDYEQKLSDIKELKDEQAQIGIQNNIIYLLTNGKEERWF
jgi:hypothetical protein